jgi:hypothetical protein
VLGGTSEAEVRRLKAGIRRRERRAREVAKRDKE